MHQRQDFWLRLLHAALALFTSFQLLSPLWMSDPGSQWLFPWHRLLGALTVLLVVLFWLHGYAMQSTGRLFPWHAAGARQSLRDLAGLLRGRLPAVDGPAGLSALVHGLGLLAISGCAITGMQMFLMIPPGHVGPPADGMAFTRWTLLHKSCSQLLWWYCAGHVALALLQQWRGQRVLQIFRLRQRAD